MTFEAERAQDYYRRVVSLLAPQDRRSLVAAEAMRLIYRRLLKKIEIQKFNVFQQRVTLTTSCKLGLALTAWGRGQLAFS
jgi:phytoene synthase